MREPTAQVMSHYNWLIEIQRRGGSFYGNHPPHIKELSDRISNSDNSNPKIVIENILSRKNLFLNFQSRTILGHKFDWKSGAVHQVLSKYEMVAKEKTMLDLIETMTGERPTILERENESGYHFDRAVFDTAEMKTFLRENNALDETLYSLIPG